MKHIWTIIDKEWAEVFQHKMVLFTMIFIPLFLVALPVLMLFLTGQSMGGEIAGDFSELPPALLSFCAAEMTPGDCMQVYLINMFMLLFMMIPVIIPVTIAAYSVVGEKTTRSLEPLLATPISTFELLAGKSLAAAIPAILAGWISFGLFLIALPLIGVSAPVMRYIISPTWLLAVLVAGPLMAIAAVNFSLFVSSRVNDPRVAEQISVLLIVPVLAALFAQLAGVIVINLLVMFSFIGGLALVDIGLIYLGVSIFQRETILTRWK
ncbi:MAG: ABC transporter permease subunit [Porticoccaceae bacterium]|nr:ABC transporter permease subunit [Porticoccaceae bacterium]